MTAQRLVIVFDWKGKSTADSTIDWNEKLHGILDRTGILTDTELNNQNFEIDSKCTNSKYGSQGGGGDRKRQPAEQGHMGVSRQFHEQEQPLFVLDIGRYRGRRCG